MKRHKFNIFPEAKHEDYQRLKQDIEQNGFDESQPIMLYQGDILDGWNRQKACDELGVKPEYQRFQGTDAEAIAYMMRTNKRRNLNSGQWATIAVEAEELVNAIKKHVEAESNRKRQLSAEGNKNAKKTIDDEKQSGQKIVPTVKADQKATGKIEDKAAHKTAELFSTNRTYVNQAAKLKAEAPQVFEQVKAGTMRMTDAAKAVKSIPKDDWRDDERKRQALCQDGVTVVANANSDQNLIAWAQSRNLALRIDRGTPYGNPFLLDKDGDRDCVCDCYAKHYLPHKPSILQQLSNGDLTGKVLVCHCHPLRCHGDTLAQIANDY